MKPKFLIAYPFGGRPVPCDWHLAVRLMQIPTNTSSLEAFRRGMKLEDAQTSMAQQALDLGAEYILFIEDDTAPPPGTICELSRVLETSDDSVMACGGIYTTRTNPPEPIVYMEPGGGSFWNWKIGDIFPCWAVGFGCLMLRTKIFTMMSRPWFKNLDTLDEIKQYPDLFPDIVARCPKRCGVTTDIFFFTKLAQMGFKVLAHGGVLPVHWDVATNEGYWLPKDTPPTRGVTFDGKPFGWTDSRIAVNV